MYTKALYISYKLGISQPQCFSYSLGPILFMSTSFSPNSQPLPRNRLGQMPLRPGAMMPLGSRLSLIVSLNRIRAWLFQPYVRATYGDGQ